MPKFNGRILTPPLFQAGMGHGAVAACVPAGGTKVVSRAIPAIRFRRLTLRSVTGTA